MLHISERTKRHILWFALAMLAGALAHTLTPGAFPFKSLSTVIYCGILIAWMLTVQKRVIQWHVRRYLVSVAGGCTLLMILRVCRWDFFTWSPDLSRWLWYAYYIPFVISPLCLLCAAKCVGRRWADKPLRRVAWLWIPCAMMAAGFLTNDLHGAAFRITPLANDDYTYTHGWLYWLMAAWCAVLLLWAFSALLRSSLIASGRRFWFIPVVWAAAFTALLFVFIANGGSPHWGRYSLYNFQEIWAALLVGTAECFILIGLIPANTDYEEIFGKLPWNAALTDRDGNVAFHSADAFLPTPEQIDMARGGAVAVDANHILRCQEIRGGVSSWLVDRTHVNRMNRHIAETVEYLEEENDLLAEENRVRAARASYETQNTIYDGVIPVVRPQLFEAERLLREETADDEAYRQNMLRAMVLCDYAKRRINLSLIAHGNASLSTSELALAIRETLEYLSAGEIETALECSEAELYPTEQLVMAYDFFEEVLETALPGLSALFVHIATKDALQLKLVMETPSALPPEGWFARQREKLGARIELSVDEESCGFVRLSFGKGGAAE
ncbi:MAG: hypothetical protein E7474_06615 [Ruminococcaceae bacterium]|nr:hypothetical protein [Oscillospiraceae bacterium]